MIEFALLLPLALFLIIGFIDLGRVVFFYSALSNAVREAARFAIVTKSALEEINDTITTPLGCDEQTGTALDTKVADFMFAAGDSLATNLSTCAVITLDGTKYEKVAIDATYCFVPITPGFIQAFGSSICANNGIPITARATMRVSPGSR